MTWLIDLADRSSGDPSAARRRAHRDHPIRRSIPGRPPTIPDNPAGDVEVAMQYRVMEALHKAGGIPLARSSATSPTRRCWASRSS